MLVKIRPYTEEEAKCISSGIVTDTNIGSPYSITSNNTFGNQEQPTDSATKKRSCDIYTKTGIIMLEMPVPNFFLCGKDLELLKKLMPSRYLERYGPRKCNMSQIINCTAIYDREKNMIIDVNKPFANSETYDRERYLIGGEAIIELIDKFDIGGELISEATLIAAKCVSSAYMKTYQSRLSKTFKDMIRATTRKETQLHIIEDIYTDLSDITYEDNSYIEKFENEEFINNYKVAMNSELYSLIYNRRIIYLLSLRDNKSSEETFRNLIQKFMLVMPIGFRPSTELGINLMSNAYNKVIKANNTLKIMYIQKHQTLTNVINSYKELVKAVKYVTVDYQALPRKAQSEISYRDIVSTLKGKEGKIRSKMQSVTLDNSGRSVIIVDPKMSIDSIGVPYTMLRELLDEHYVAALPSDMNPMDKLKKLEQFKSDVNFEKTKRWIDNYVKNIPAVAGRQPTLWKFGIQGFKIVPVDGSAIVLAPLCVVAFNADFDGDQMHINVPLTQEAIEEVLSIVMNIKNIYLARDGSCHISPRHEIIYGLWLASKAKISEDSVCIGTFEKLDSDLINNIHHWISKDVYALHDYLTISGHRYTLGHMAIKSCAGVKYADYIVGTKELTKSNKLYSNRKDAVPNETEDGEFTEEWSVKLLTKIHDSMKGDELFVKTVNNYTVIGMAIATNYPPNVSITKLPNVDAHVKKFNKDIEKVQHYYDIGFETEVGYRNQYSRAYARLKKAIEDDIFKPGSSNYLGDDNGFSMMAASKCRGNKSTMMQMFGIKGRVMKNANEVFNSIIPHSMARGLTGLEHMITAYGGRQGQMDKSIETSKPGYISRIMAVADCGIVIKSTDCQTTEGIKLTYNRLRFYLAKSSVSEEATYLDIKSMFSNMVVGRYLIEKTDSYVEQRDVDSLFRTYIAEFSKDEKSLIIKDGCQLRSPITCKDPCCAKCYGIDLTTHNRVAVGRAVGVEAAQSIGQPGTQLTMKSFQNGGVASEGNLTSSFELMQKYLELTDLNAQVKLGRPIKTDTLSPVEADISEIYVGRNLKQVYIVNSKTGKVVNSNTPIIMFAGIKLKKHVLAGENIQVELGDLNTSDVLECRGVDELILYLNLKLFQIFNREISVNMKHFETLIASMIFYVCKKSVGQFRAGIQYTHVAYMQGRGYEYPENFHKVVNGAKSVPDASSDCLRSILFEDLLDAVRKHIITSPTDTVTDPWVRLSLGLMPNVGSEVNR